MRVVWCLSNPGNTSSRGIFVTLQFSLIFQNTCFIVNCQCNCAYLTFLALGILSTVI